MRIYGLYSQDTNIRRGYLQSAWSILELVVIGAGIADLILTLTQGGPSWQLLRALRVLAIFRLAKGFEDVEEVHIFLQSYALTARRCAGVVVCIVVFNICFAAMGLTLFRGKRQLSYFCAHSNTSLVLPPRHCPAPANLAHRIFFTLEGHRCISPAESCVEMKDVPSLDGLHAFDTISESIMTLWTLLSYGMDRFIALETVDAIGLNVPFCFFLAVTVLGAIILYSYFTAIFVLAYLECKGRFELEVIDAEDFATSEAFETEIVGSPLAVNTSFKNSASEASNAAELMSSVYPALCNKWTDLQAKWASSQITGSANIPRVIVVFRKQWFPLW